MTTTTYATTNSQTLSALASAPAAGTLQSDSAPNSWFQALADAWAQTLDSEAATLDQMSNSISSGNDNPSQITQLTAESLKFSYISQSENTSLDSVGSALQTMARKS